MMRGHHRYIIVMGAISDIYRKDGLEPSSRMVQNWHEKEGEWV